MENCAYAYKNGNKPTTDAQWANLYPASTSTYSEYYGNLKQGLESLDENWSELYRNYNDENGLLGSDRLSASNGHNSLVLLGMAIHCAMDSYAHSFASEISKGCFLEYTSDDKNDIPARYDTAKAVGRSMLEKWDENNGVFQISQFYQPSVHKAGTEAQGGFYMKRLLKYVLSVQPNLASISPTKYNWFYERNYDYQ